MRVLLLLIVGLVLFAGCSRASGEEPIPGVRLGMTPRDVRDRFEGGAAGAWQTRASAGAGASDDTVIEWTANDVQSRTTHARFEFHLGMLVAIRAHLRDAVKSEQVDVTPKTVTLRTPSAGTGGSDVTILARDCPTHHEEAEGLASKAR